MEWSDVDPPSRKNDPPTRADRLRIRRQITWSSCRYLFYAGLVLSCLLPAQSRTFYWLENYEGVRVELSLLGPSVAYGWGWDGRKGLARRSYAYNEPIGINLLGFILDAQSSEFGGNIPTDIEWRTVGIPWWIPFYFLLARRVARLRRKWFAEKVRRKRALLGNCPNCGYDLRATPSKAGPLLTTCPECGASHSGQRKSDRA